MRDFRRAAAIAVIVAAAVASRPTPVAAQAYRMTGVSPIFDGWDEKPDGMRVFYFGYINRNPTEVTVPVGADNGFEPGPVDRGQPTTFLQGRHEHVFTITVPKNMAGKIVWRVKSEMGVQTANASFDQLYILEQRENAHPDAKPPEVATAELTARVGEPLPVAPQVKPALNSGRVEVEGAATDSEGLNVLWSKHRGPGSVAFKTVAAAPPVTSGRGRGGAAQSRPGIHAVPCGTKPAANCGAIVATFSAPGGYTLRAAAQQDGLQGLAFIKVTVTP